MTEFSQVLRNRRSSRAFIPASVPLDVIETCVELAQLTPSNCNVQPWRVFVVSGQERDKLAHALTDAFMTDNEEPLEHPMERFSGIYYDLQIECAMEMYGKMGIKRADRRSRHKATARNFSFFDAPHVAIICMEREFSVGGALDVGMWVQSFLLALTSFGVQSCTQASLRSYPDLLRRVLSIPSTLTPLCGVSFGYEEEGAPVNSVRPGRRPVSENVTFIS